MNREQTNTLADKLARSWPRGLGNEIWEDVLADLHHGPAEAAVRQLRANETSPPTVAAYLSVYRSLLGSAPRVECDRCNGSGLVTTSHARREVGPCNCRNGADARGVLQRINAGNDAEPALLDSRHRVERTPPPPRKEPLL